MQSNSELEIEWGLLVGIPVPRYKVKNLPLLFVNPPNSIVHWAQSDLGSFLFNSINCKRLSSIPAFSITWSLTWIILRLLLLPFTLFHIVISLGQSFSCIMWWWAAPICFQRGPHLISPTTDGHQNWALYHHQWVLRVHKRGAINTLVDIRKHCISSATKLVLCFQIGNTPIVTKGVSFKSPYDHIKSCVRRSSFRWRFLCVAIKHKLQQIAVYCLAYRSPAKILRNYS